MSQLLELVGNTPLVELSRLNPNPKVKIFGKLEGNNPGGSVKDRAAKNMIEGAIARGELKAGMKLIEATSGNTGIALDIKRYLLDIINDNNNDLEKFSDSRINQAQHLLDRAGPAAFYWMGEIAAQLALLSAAQINGIPTNVNAELRDGATPESIVDVVIKI